MAADGWQARGSRWLARRMPVAQIRLDRRRIVLLPTRAGLAYLAVLLLMLLLAINYQNSPAYALSFLLASLFVVAILHTYRNLAGLDVRAGAAPAVFAGGQAGVRIVLEGGALTRHAVSLGWSSTPAQCLDVPARRSVACELGLPAPRRGWLATPPLRVESRFPLGVLVAWRWIDLQQRIVVYPQPLAGELPHRPGTKGQDAGPLAVGEGCDDFHGLRAYQPGDGKRRLHWKAYSRGQGLLVKAFAEQADEDYRLDLQRLDGPLEECLSRLCQGVLQRSASGQPFTLCLPGVTLGPDSGGAHRDACLRALALFGALEAER